jgi:hypothetical protein
MEKGTIAALPTASGLIENLGDNRNGQFALCPDF